MISRYDAWLNGDSISSVSPSIYVADISYSTAARSYATSQVSGRDGTFSGRDYVAPSTVAISFVVREYNTARRQEVAQDVARWAARGGWLRTSDRVGQRLYVRCTKPPAISSVLRWLNTLTVEFTAHDFPMWQDEAAEAVTLNSGDSGTLFLRGTRQTEVCAEITAGATLTGFTITCGDTAVTLEGLNIAQGQTVNIRYTDDHHILEIVSGGASLLDKRTANSSDDLIAQIGDNSVSYASSGASTCVLSVRGVYA